MYTAEIFYIEMLALIHIFFCFTGFFLGAKSELQSVKVCSQIAFTFKTNLYLQDQLGCVMHVTITISQSEYSLRSVLIATTYICQNSHMIHGLGSEQH